MLLFSYLQDVPKKRSIGRRGHKEWTRNKSGVSLEKSGNFLSDEPKTPNLLSEMTARLSIRLIK